MNIFRVTPLLVVAALIVGYLFALAGAPQQHWFYCQILHLCE
jgi:hypothetical protein